jgi:hypothetical protein
VRYERGLEIFALVEGRLPTRLFLQALTVPSWTIVVSRSFATPDFLDGLAISPVAVKVLKLVKALTRRSGTHGS